MKNGKKNWVFCDGDLPPQGDNPNFQGHEALMITNVSKKDAHIRIKVLFEDRPPYDQVTIDHAVQAGDETASILTAYTLTINGKAAPAEPFLTPTSGQEEPEPNDPTGSDGTATTPIYG